MTRDEHLQWAKTRALEYVDRGEFSAALASMSTDLNKHPELSSSAARVRECLVAFSETLNSEERTRRFIEEFRS